MYKNTYYIKHCKAKISNCQVSFLLIKKALSTLRWYSLKNELQQCVKSCLRTAFLVAFDKDLLEQNPFSKMIKTPKTKGNAFDKLTEIIFSL